MDLVLGDVGSLEHALDGLHAILEVRHAKLLEFGSSKSLAEVFALIETINLNGGLISSRKDSLGSLALGSESSQSSGVVLHLHTSLSLELSQAILNNLVVKVLTTQMGVTISGSNLEEAILNGKQRDIESTTTQIEDQDISLALALLVQTISNGSSSGLIEDSHDIQASDSASILGGISLGIIKVGRDSDDSVLNLLTKVSLGIELQLAKHHRGDLLGEESLLLALELNLKGWLVIRAGGKNLERPQLHVVLDGLVIDLSADKSLGVENCVQWVSLGLVFSRFTDQSLRVGKTDI